MNAVRDWLLEALADYPGVGGINITNLYRLRYLSDNSSLGHSFGYYR